MFLNIITMSVGNKILGALKVGQKVFSALPAGARVAGHIASGMSGGGVNVGNAISDVKALAGGIANVVSEVNNVISDLA
jgi:hypothetical protein